VWVWVNVCVCKSVRVHFIFGRDIYIICGSHQDRIEMQGACRKAAYQHLLYRDRTRVGARHSRKHSEPRAFLRVKQSTSDPQEDQQ